MNLVCWNEYTNINIIISLEIQSTLFNNTTKDIIQFQQRQISIETIQLTSGI